MNWVGAWPKIYTSVRKKNVTPSARSLLNARCTDRISSRKKISKGGGVAYAIDYGYDKPLYASVMNGRKKKEATILFVGWRSYFLLVQWCLYLISPMVSLLISPLVSLLISPMVFLIE